MGDYWCRLQGTDEWEEVVCAKSMRHAVEWFARTAEYEHRLGSDKPMAFPIRVEVRAGDPELDELLDWTLSVFEVERHVQVTYRPTIVA